jgi:hypothetical protein
MCFCFDFIIISIAVDTFVPIFPFLLFLQFLTVDTEPLLYHKQSFRLDVDYFQIALPTYTLYECHLHETISVFER